MGVKEGTMTEPLTADDVSSQPVTTPPGGTAESASTQSSTPSAMPGYHDTKATHLARLRRIEGQVRGLQRMVDSDTYCIDVLTQVSAATRALESFALGLLHEHLSHCVSHAIEAGHDSDEARAEAEAKIREASDAIARLVRS
jgi:DNA-binding FrmR family transcriptional regulator